MSLWRSEVDLSSDRCERNTVRFGQIDECLELGWRAGQPVDVPDDEGRDLVPRDVTEQSLVLRTTPSGARTDVVVDVGLGGGPAAICRQPSAVFDLSRDTKRASVVR